MKLILKSGLILAAVWLLTILSCNAQNNIVSYRYWFDNEYTAGKQKSVLPAELLELKSSVVLDGLVSGLHIFTIMFKDEKGLWSIPSSQFFFYPDLANNKIIEYQYWFDNDYNSNKQVSLSPNQILNLNIQLPIESINEGLHILCIRFKDNAGNWSSPANHYFYKSKSTNATGEINIVAYRYWLNDEIGNAKYINISNPSSILYLNEDLKITGIPSGEYTIHFQFKDAAGKWSLVTSDNFFFDNKSSQKIIFSGGWNMFSVNVIPENPDLKSVFQLLIDNTSLVKIQDELGNSMENWGSFGGWTNNIGDVLASEGYRIKLNAKDSLEVNGEPVKYPFYIALKKGWNIMGYPQRNSFNGMENIVQQLINKGTLVKVQDQKGNSIEDWENFGGWTNNIGDFIPGEGYRIKVNADDTLWIYENYTKSTEYKAEKVATRHFQPAFEGNGFDHMNINIVNLPISSIQPGDEFAVFDGSTCVGAVTVLTDHIKFNTVSIAASANDKDDLKGFKEGNPVILKFWSSMNNKEFTLNPEILKGLSTFIKYESTFVSLEKYASNGIEGLMISEQPEIKCYPNPFSDELTVEINLATEAEVSAEVLNLLGQRIKYLSNKQRIAKGINRFSWNGRNAENRKVAPGIYYIHVNINGNKFVRKIVLY